MALLDLLDAFGGEHGAAAREDAVHGLAFLTAGSSLGTHAALADDDLHARFPEEFALVLLHAHGGRRADGDDAEAGAALVVGNHDGTGVEDGLAGEVVRKVHAFLDMAEVNHVAARDEGAREIEHVADLQGLDVGVGNRCRQNFLRHFAVLPNQSVMPLWLIIS